MRKLRIYVDTSVFGGCFDQEFKIATDRFFQQVKAGRFGLVVSPLVEEELRLGPEYVLAFFDELLSGMELQEIFTEALELRDAYLAARIVSSRYATDALHVALATIAGCSLIVSWNFKHIVNFRKIPLYNAINTIRGYRHLAIFSPLEVISDEEEQDL